MRVISFYGEYADFGKYQKALNTNRYGGNAIKQEQTNRAAWECKKQKIAPVESYPVMLSFFWYSPNARTDIDNVAFAKKFLLDGLVKAGVLIDDSRKYIAGFKEERFYIDKYVPRVEVSIHEPDELSTHE